VLVGLIPIFKCPQSANGTHNYAHMLAYHQLYHQWWDVLLGLVEEACGGGGVRCRLGPDVMRAFPLPLAWPADTPERKQLTACRGCTVCNAAAGEPHPNRSRAPQPTALQNH
jgi:hypothetical protein